MLDQENDLELWFNQHSLEINLDDFDKDIKERTIELIRIQYQEINEKNNLYTGSAFTQS